MHLVEQRIKDRKVLNLVRSFLKAGVVQQHGGFAASLTGTPQGAGVCATRRRRSETRRWLRAVSGRRSRLPAPYRHP
jgi:hypothetical protein